MNPRDAARARLRAFYWPPSVPLRRLATINAAFWLLVSFVDLTQPTSGGGFDLVFYGPFLALVTWALIRLCVYDAGGRLAPRLPFRWMRARGGRALFSIQALTTLFLVQHDVVSWAVLPTLRTLTGDLAAGAAVLGITWGAPAVAVAVYTQARLLGSGQTESDDQQPPPNGQQWQQQSNPYESWDYTQQDIPQDEAWTQPPPGAYPPPPIHDAAWACSVLHVHPNASLEQIERVYKNLAATWHPDTAQSPEEQAEKEAHMRGLNEAINLLRTSRKSTA